MVTNYARSVRHNPWSQLSLFLFLFGGGWILANIAGAGILIAKVGIANAGKAMDLSDPRLSGTLKGVQALTSMIFFGIPAFGYAWRTFRDNPMQQLGFRPTPHILFYLLAILLLVASVPFEGWLGQLNKAIPLPGWMVSSETERDKQIISFLKAGSFAEVLNNIFIIAVLPAIFEEACFRGALQRILIQLFKSAWPGILVTAIVFSAIHIQFQGFLPRMLLGTLLGAIYWYSGSLWVAILGHFFINGIQVVAVTYYPKFVEDNPSVPVYTALISLAIVVGLLYFMHKRSSASFAQVYADRTDGSAPPL
jgi:uncharacterized protein